MSDSKQQKIGHLSPEQEELIGECYDDPHKIWKSNFIFFGDQKFLLEKDFANGEKILNFEGRPQDVWVCVFPRSGTTWMSETAWLLQNDLNFAEASKTLLNTRVPIFELELMIGGKTKGAQQTLREVDLYYKQSEKMSLPMVRRTHIPLHLLPNIKSCSKIIYVARNPKDVLISYYLLHKNFSALSFTAKLEDFWKLFRQDLIPYTPYWEHLKSAWKMRHQSNVLFVFYEEMIQDLSNVLKKIAAFLGKSYTDEDYQKLCEHLQFKNVKKNKMINRDEPHFKDSSQFVRAGKIQAWNQYFSPELNAEINEWIKDNMKDTDLKFKYVDIFA